MTASVAAVILNYNGKSYLEKFLGTAIENSSDNCEIIVIDNASTDDSLEYLQKHYPQIKCIVLEKNHGFAGGYNRGLEQLSHDIFILINSDIELTKNWDIPLVKRLEKPEIAACQPKILAYDNKSSFEYAGASGGYLDREYFPFCRGRIFGELEADLGQYDQAQQVFWATGACMAIKSADFKRMEGFDEDFFAHMEEIDLCHRLKNVGKEIWVEPKSVVYHVGGGTLAMMSPFKTFLNYRNGLSLLVKNYPYSDFKWVLFKRLILDGISGLNFLARGLPQHTWQIYKAHRAFFKQWDKALEKREKLAKSHKNINRSGFFRGSIIWQYFLGRKNKFEQLPKHRFVTE